MYLNLMNLDYACFSLPRIEINSNPTHASNDYFFELINMHHSW